MNEEIYNLAHKISGDYFTRNMMYIMGAKVTGEYMYVKGGDNGFPRVRAHVKVDLNTNKIIAYYGAFDCPVCVTEGMYC